MINKEDIICPGETIKELLEIYNYTQDDLAKKLDLNLKTVNEILNGKAPITIETSIKLEYIFNIDASFWNNLELNYRRMIMRYEEEKKMLETYEIIKETYKEMVKRKLVKDSKEKEEKVSNFKKYMEITDLSQLSINQMQLAFRKANTNYNYLNLLVWIQIGMKKAREIEINEFKKENILSRLKDIKKLSLLEDQVKAREKLKEICAESGIILNYESSMPKAAVFGIAKWLTPTKPFIQISDRRKDLSTFYFTFMHELGHIIIGRKKESYIDILDIKEQKETDNNDKRDIRIIKEVEEIKADNFARNNLVNEKEYKIFIKNGINEKEILKFSTLNGVNPAIVTGFIKHDLEKYNSKMLNKFDRKIEFENV